MSTAHDVYDASVRDLAQSDKLQLATLILQDLTEKSAEVVDFGDSWSEEDMRDFARFAAAHAAKSYPEPDASA